MATSSNKMIQLLYLTVHLLAILAWQSSATISRTGFESLPFDKSVYRIQSPYNLPESKRYSFENGVHKCWVYSNDLPHARTSHTSPRTEIAIEGYQYNSGVWEFEADVYVPRGTTGVSIMQVFGSRGPTATSLMLHVYNGNLRYYNKQVVQKNIYNRWFKLNVVDDFDSGKINVYINDKLKLEVNGRGGEHHFFKCGVYGQRNKSRRMESRWRNIRISRKA